VAALEGHAGGVRAVTASENGYYLASGGVDGTVKIWDLRKVECLTTLVRAGAAAAGAGAPPSAVTALAFDASGLYLAAGTAVGGLAAWDTKEWAEVGGWAPHTDAVTGIAWSRHAHALTTTSLDRTLKVFAAPAAGSSQS